jgi:hypothetical protein
VYLYPPEGGWLPILVASYDTHGLRWDYSYSPVTTRGTALISVRLKFRVMKIAYILKRTNLPRFFDSYSSTMENNTSMLIR